MTREPTGNDVLDELYRKHDKLEVKLIQLGQELGYCDENGDFEIIEKDTLGTLTELEKKRLESKENLEKEFEITFISLEMAKLSFKIRAIESNMGLIKNA